MITSLEKLKRIKARLSGQGHETADESYEIECHCGEIVRGKRRHSWVESKCSACGHLHFVLPVNPYPSTESVPSEVLVGRFSDRLKVVVSEFFPSRKKESVAERTTKKRGQSRPRATYLEPDADDQQSEQDSEDYPGDFAPEPEDMSPQPVETKSRSKKNRAVKLESDSGTAEPLNSPALAVPSLPKIDVAGITKRIFTPFRLLLVAGVAVIWFTVSAVISRQETQDAHQIWLDAEESIEEQLRSEDMVGLRDVLTKTLAAGETLELTDSDWRIRSNLLGETHAVLDLSNHSMLDAFDAVYPNGQFNPAATNSVESLVGDVFVFDTWVTRHNDSCYTLDLPLTPGNHRVNVYLPFAAIPGLGDADGRAILAARVRNVKKPSAASSQWHVLLDPESVYLLTSDVHCRQVGLDPDYYPDIRSVIDGQREFVAQSADWADRTLKVSMPQAFVGTEEETP